MKQRANATFVIKGWDEKPYDDAGDLPKLTRASVTKTFSGDIEGESRVEYLMMYGADGSATYVGLERVLIEGRPPSLRRSGRGLSLPGEQRKRRLLPPLQVQQ